MKVVLYTDAKGLTHRALLPDEVPETEAVHGLAQDPPPFLQMLDWEQMGKDLWNMLVAAGITNWQAHQENPHFMASAIRQIIFIPLVNLYKAEGNKTLPQ